MNDAGFPISSRYGGGGQTVRTAVTAQVAGGAFDLPMPGTALTVPANVCFAVTITDNVSGDTLLSYPCVRPSTASRQYAAVDHSALGRKCQPHFAVQRALP